MESRYYTAKTKKTFDGREVYRPKIYPTIPLSDDDLYVATETGDRLDILAYQFYQDSSYWWIISAANPDLPKDSLYPPLGYQLRIPVFDADIIRSLDILNA